METMVYEFFRLSTRSVHHCKRISEVTGTFNYKKFRVDVVFTYFINTFCKDPPSEADDWTI
jgi:hypothetical protein